MIGQGVTEKKLHCKERNSSWSSRKRVSTGKAVYIPGDIQNELEKALSSLTSVGPASIRRLGQMAPRDLFQPKSLYDSTHDPHRSDQ